MRRLGLLLMVVTFAGSGCAATTNTYPVGSDAPPAADVSGKWVGTWIGYDAMGFPRTEDATADLHQQDGRGTGRLVLHTTGIAWSVPDSLRDPGLTGARVQFDVSGNDVLIRHERSGLLFAADLKVDGDRMVGYVRGAKPPVKVVLARGSAPTTLAAAPPAPAVEVAPAPAPVAPEPVAAEPPKEEQPKEEQQVAAVPEPPPAPAPAEPVRPVPAEFAGIAEVKAIHFDFDKSDIRPGDAEVLDANAAWLKDNEERVVLIEGHCDELGTPEYNQALGERRAGAARDYLIERGVAPERISVVSFGAERPICTDGTEACRAENRRVMFLVKPR